MAAPPRKLTLAQVLEQANERLSKLEKNVRGMTPDTPGSRALGEYLKRSRHWIDIRATRLVDLKDIKLTPRLSEEFEVKLVKLDGGHSFGVTCTIVDGFLDSTHKVIGGRYPDARRALSVLPGQPDVPYEPPPKPVISMSGNSDVPIIPVFPDLTRSGR